MAGNTSGTNTLKLKKGEILFNEGDRSASMYFIQNGSIRLFKKKGQASIELGVVHKGEVLGEMGFLDGGPRSASGEALYDTELVEVNSVQMGQQLKQFPPWLTIMLKTIVTRLRKANDKIRQLESSGMTVNYGDGASVYEFINAHDVIKICAATLLCASRGAENVNGAAKFSMNRLIRYAHQVIGVPQAKITEMIDLFERIGIAKVDRASVENVLVYVVDAEQLDSLLNFIVDENAKESSKKFKVSIRGIIIMGYIVRHLALFPADALGMSEVNLAKIIKIEKDAAGGKEPFRLDEFNELIQQKIANEVQMKDGENILTKIHAKDLIRMFKMQKAMKEIENLNEKKRTVVGKSAVGGTRS